MTLYTVWGACHNPPAPGISVNFQLGWVPSGKSADNFKKILDLDGLTLEPMVWSGDTGRRIPCFDSCQLITTLIRGVTIHILNNLIRFRLLPFDFDYFDSIM